MWVLKALCQELGTETKYIFIMPHSFITLLWSKYFPCGLKIKHPLSGKMAKGVLCYVCLEIFRCNNQ